MNPLKEVPSFVGVCSMRSEVNLRYSGFRMNSNQRFRLHNRHMLKRNNLERRENVNLEGWGRSQLTPNPICHLCGDAGMTMKIRKNKLEVARASLSLNIIRVLA